MASVYNRGGGDCGPYAIIGVCMNKVDLAACDIESSTCGDMSTYSRAVIRELRETVADHAEQCPAGVFGTFRGETFADGRTTAFDESKPIDKMFTDPRHPIETRVAWKRVAQHGWWDARHILVAAHLLGLEGFQACCSERRWKPLLVRRHIRRSPRTSPHGFVAQLRPFRSPRSGATVCESNNTSVTSWRASLLM